METVDRDRSFACFIYPFLFELPRKSGPGATSGGPDADPFRLFADRVAGAEMDGKKIWVDWPTPVHDLMPHVARFLDPVKTRQPTGRFLQLGNDVSQKLQSDKITWQLRCGKSMAAIPFELGGAGFVMHLALFRHKVGFLTVSARPLSDSLEDWQSFLHDFRFMQHRDDVRIGAEKEGYDPAARQKTRLPFLPFNLSATGDGPSFCFMAVIRRILEASGLDVTEVFRPGHTLPYAGLFARGVEGGAMAVALYKLRNFFSSREGTNPSPDDLCPDHPAHLSYARHQWFLQTLNGGLFVAFESADSPNDAFQKSALPAHLRQAYFCSSLLALYQRFALARLSEKVATTALDGGGEEWADIRDDLLDFTARGYFTQAMQSDHHHRHYRKWQQVFLIHQLYGEVRDEVRDLYERASFNLRQQNEAREKREEEREKRTGMRLSLLGLLFVIPSLALSFLGVNIRGVTSSEGLSLPVALGLLAGGFALAYLTFVFLSKSGNKADRGRRTEVVETK